MGIVAGISDEIGLAKLIDEKAGMVQRKVSCGQAVQTMVMNALGFSSCALYMMPDYLHNKPVELLIGSGLRAEDFNDDTLGRRLDDLYESGVTELLPGSPARHCGCTVLSISLCIWIVVRSICMGNMKQKKAKQKRSRLHTAIHETIGQI